MPTIAGSKRPAPSRSGPKPKKAHTTSTDPKEGRRSRPVTQPLSVAEDVDSDDEEADLVDGEEEAGEEAMDVDGPHAPKDPNGTSYTLVPVIQN